MNEKKKYKLMQGDNMESLKKLPDNSIDSIVSDPPYGLSFMGKKWDYDVPSVEFWKEVYRVLKPGGHVLSFGGTRTYHRMVVNIEDAGFEIRDQIMWLYGSGFPKSLNIGKAVDKLQGNEREVVGKQTNLAGRNDTLMGDRTDSGAGMFSGVKKEIDITKGTSPWEGWGTALKPANEPICVARKPLSEKSVAENVLKWGTGGINVDGCRVGSEGSVRKTEITNIPNSDSEIFKGANIKCKRTPIEGEGRFPANIILECICDEVNKRDIHTNPMCPCRLMDEQSGVSKSSKALIKGGIGVSDIIGANKKEGGSLIESIRGHNDSGGASRFFYQAKVSKNERNMGLDGFEGKEVIRQGLAGDHNNPVHNNTHPTLKPVQLMTYLCRMVTPPNGIVLDPFMGSGSTGIAAQLEGFRFCGMEMEEEYFKIAQARIENWEKYKEFKK